MSKRLRIGKDGFTLSLDLTTSTQAILARKRSGKSYTGSVQAEELLEHKQQIGVIDPTGAWWGLRSSADGNGPGYPVVVFGGNHEDAPLDWRAGKAMAAAFVEHGFSAIFDIRGFTTAEQCTFVMYFTAELLRINSQAVHLFIDEADTFAPQKPRFPEQAKCGATVSRLVSQGGIQGIGVTMITQRSQKIDKDLLTQVDMLTVLRMGHPLDIAPAFDWITSEVNPEFAKEVKRELPRLPVGTAFFCSAKDEIGQRVEVRARRTFNSGATPKPGERKIEPKVLAKIDIEKLGQEISASVKRVREESPEFLKQRIRELEASATTSSKPTAVTASSSLKPEREQMLLETINTLETSLARTKKTAGAYEKAMDGIYSQAGKMQDAATAIRGIVDGVRESIAVAAEPAKPQNIATKTRVVESPYPIARPRPATTTSGDDLPGPEKRIINAIGWFHDIGLKSANQSAVAFMANYSPTSSSYTKARGKIVGAGLVEFDAGNVKLTRAGLDEAVSVDVPTTDEGLQQVVISRLPGPEAKLLVHLIKAWPDGMSNEELADASGYSVTSSSYTKARGRLGSFGFSHIESGRVFAEDILFPRGGA